MPSVETPAASKAGIVTSATGERHIPSSVRADGSVRKEIKIKPGYRPPEDVEVYKNRTAEGFRQRGTGGIPGAEGMKTSTDAPKPSATNKNAKRREARKKAAASSSTTGDTTGDKSNEDQAKVTNSNLEPNKLDAVPPEPVDPAVQQEKEAKKVLKKLRQAKDLKDKKEKGEGLLPEQLEKVIKINELIRQLDNLGFDANGEKKSKT